MAYRDTALERAATLWVLRQRGSLSNTELADLFPIAKSGRPKKLYRIVRVSCQWPITMAVDVARKLGRYPPEALAEVLIITKTMTLEEIEAEIKAKSKSQAKAGRPRKTVLPESSPNK